MTYHVGRVDNQPIILNTIARPFDFANDTYALHSAGSDLVQNMGDSVWSIMDLSSLHMNFGELITMMEATGAQNEGLDPRIKHLVFVGTDSMVTMAAIGLKNTQYGGVSTHYFRTIEAALNFVEAQETESVTPF